MKLIFRDKEYLSFKRCYDDNKDIAKVSLPTFTKRVRQGVSIEEALSKPKCLSRVGSHTVEGVSYPNLPSIARAYGIGEWLVYRRYYNGKRGDDLVPLKKRKSYVPPEPKRLKREIEVGGVKYKSIRAACRALGISLHTYKNRRRTGRNLEECLGIVPFVNRLTLKAKTYEIDGEYLTVKQIGEKFGIYAKTFSHRLKSGKSVKEAATTKSRKRKSKLRPENT